MCVFFSLISLFIIFGMLILVECSRAYQVWSCLMCLKANLWEWHKEAILSFFLSLGSRSVSFLTLGEVRGTKCGVLAARVRSAPPLLLWQIILGGKLHRAVQFTLVGLLCKFPCSFNFYPIICFVDLTNSIALLCLSHLIPIFFFF